MTGTINASRALTGTLFTTYEYPLAGSMEIGLGGGAAARKEGQWFHAHGPAAVVVHSKGLLPLQALQRCTSSPCGPRGGRLRQHPCVCERNRFRAFYPYRSLLGSRCPVPQGL